MIKYLRLQLIFIFLSLPVLFAQGQDEADILENITEKFLNYCKAVPREEIYVHTDRSIYIAGEEFWFSIYLFDRQGNMPGLGSKLAYMELLNSDNRPVVQKRIRLENGIGPGQITLPDTLSTGKYTLRAYTNWMKNFLPVNCFMKEIIIYNAISDKTLKGNTLASRKLFDATDYSAWSLTGLELDVDNLRPDTLILNITSDKNFLAENKSLCYIFIQTNGKINFSERVRLYSGNTRIELEKENISPGVNQITLFNARGNPLITRNIYTPDTKNYSLRLRSQDSCSLREKVLLEIDGGSSINHPGNTSLSVSVAPVINGNKIPGLDDYMVFGSEYGIVPPEIKNRVLDEIQPEIIDKFLSGVKSNWIDWNMVMSGKFNVFKYLRETDEHFLSGKMISTNNVNTDSSGCLFLSTPGKDAIFKYSRTGKDGSFNFSLPITEEVQDIIIQPEKTDGNSAVRIEPSYSEEYFTLPEADNNPPFAIAELTSGLSINYQVGKIYESRYLGEPVNSELKLPDPKRFYGKPDIEIRLADYIELPVMEEVFFELTPGVILKNKKSVFYMSIADRIDGRIYEKPPLMFIDGVVVNDPAVIAGLDPEKVEKIDAVKDLYLVGDYMFFGIVNVITKAGDYSLVTLPDYAVRLKYRVVEPVRTFHAPDYSSAEMKQSRIPDFRNTLYWNPSVKPGDDGKIRVEFWSGDVKGDYEVNVQGVNPEGKPVSIRKIIKSVNR